MNFKVDENLPLEVADMLREAGHDALTVHDQNLVGHLIRNCRLSASWKSGPSSR